MGERKNLVFPITAPDGSEILPNRQWLWSSERVENAVNNGELEFIKNKNGVWSVHTKQYLKNKDGKIRKDKAFSIIDNVYTQHGTNEIIDLFENAQIFPFPKPVNFLNFLNEIGIEDTDGIIIDFFPGSCSTAHAIIEQNKNDGGNRKFIMVQMPEKCEENSEAYKAGYETIADIGKERIRRVIKKIKDDQLKVKKEKGENLFDNHSELDLGFKVFKLRESNFKIWRTNIKTKAELTEQIQQHIEPLDENAKTENVLYELLLKSGVPLTDKILEKDGYYLVNDNEIALILETVNTDIIKSVIAKNPRKVITLDRLFNKNDQLKTNAALQMKDAGIEFKVV